MEDSLYHEKSQQLDSLVSVQAKKEGNAESMEWHRTPFKPQEVYSIMSLGDNILFKLLSRLFVADQSLLPNAFELIHYPFLLAGYLALFFTALNYFELQLSV